MESKASKGKETDGEVPVLRFCCLSLSERPALDLATPHDFSVLLEALDIGNTSMALEAVKTTRKLLSTGKKMSRLFVIKAGRIDVLHKAMKPKSEEIRYEAISNKPPLLPLQTDFHSSKIRLHYHSSGTR